MRPKHSGQAFAGHHADPRAHALHHRHHGVVISASHSIEPVLAPATEYVEMPDGSSSAAPVIKPGPSTEEERRRARFGLRQFIASRSWFSPYPNAEYQPRTATMNARWRH